MELFDIIQHSLRLDRAEYIIVVTLIIVMVSIVLVFGMSESEEMAETGVFNVVEEMNPRIGASR